MARGAWRLIEGGAELRIRASANAAADLIEAMGEDAAGQRFLKIRVRAVAEKGKANAALERLLADALTLPRSAVSVQKGASQRIKTVKILSDPSIAAKLAALTGDPDGG